MDKWRIKGITGLKKSMKRKYESEGEETKRVRLEGSFSILSKRKHDFEEPRAKRYHEFNIVEDQQRTIRHLENTVQVLLNKIKQLEYQLTIERVSSHHSAFSRPIQSF